MRLASSLQKLTAEASGPIARSAISGMAMRLLGLGLVFVQAILAARILGPEQYGVVSLLLAISQIAAAIILCGFGGFAVAEVPRLLAGQQPKGVSQFLSHALWRIAYLSLFVVPVTLVGLIALPGITSPWAMALALASAPLLAMLQLFRGVAQGLERPIYSQAPNDVARPAVFLTGLLAFWLMFSVDSIVFLALYLVAVGLSILIALPSLRPVETRKYAPTADTYQPSTQQWNSAARPFLAMQLVTILEVELATILLGIFASPEAVGLFQPIARIAVVLVLPVFALNLRFNPRVASLFAAGKRSDIIRLSRKYTVSCSLVVLATGAAIGLAAPWLLLLFGPEFAPAAPIVWLIVAGRFGAALFGPAFQLLVMTKRSWPAVQAIATGLLIQVILGALLISQFGLLGAGIAVALGTIARALLAARTCHAKLGIGLADFWFAQGRESKPA